MNGKYILVDGQPVPCADVRVWGQWFETADRQVARDEIGDVIVSTVFLGLDHSFLSGPPLLWETMVFGGKHDEECHRYSSELDARRGHDEVVASVKGRVYDRKFREG